MNGRSRQVLLYIIDFAAYRVFLSSDPCGENTKQMIGDTWIPDPNNRCRRCVCQEGESPGVGVAICTDDQDCLAGVEGEWNITNQLGHPG